MLIYRDPSVKIDGEAVIKKKDIILIYDEKQACITKKKKKKKIKNTYYFIPCKDERIRGVCNVTQRLQRALSIGSQ